MARRGKLADSQKASAKRTSDQRKETEKGAGGANDSAVSPRKTIFEKNIPQSFEWCTQQSPKRQSAQFKLFDFALANEASKRSNE